MSAARNREAGALRTRTLDGSYYIIDRARLDDP